MQHVMLDLETMGTGPSAAVVAIGAIAFDLTDTGGTMGPTFYQTIGLANAMASGGQVDAGTVLWWLRQSDEARAVFQQGQDGDATEHAWVLVRFAEYMSNLGTDPQRVRVWGNGASFDNVILACAYRRAGLALPWNNFNDRCYRTIKAMQPDVKLQRTGTHHHALDDAIAQARHLIQLLRGVDAVIEQKGPAV
jgi:exodeoxyribonuclease VIII